MALGGGSRGSKVASSSAPAGSLDATMELINSKRFSITEAIELDDIISKHEMMREAGLPPMLVIPGRVLEDLGRIPHYSEGHAVDIIDELRRHDKDSKNRPRAVTVYLSHRWLRPGWNEDLQREMEPLSREVEEAVHFGVPIGHPDDSENTKAKTLCEWRNWFTWYMTQGDMDKPLLGNKITWCPFEVLFFIDYSCINPEERQKSTTAIPAYMFMSSLLLAYDISSGLMNRAWCGAELMLSHSLSTVNTVMSVPEGFKFKNQFGFDMSTDIMPDPTFGDTFLGRDKPSVRDLCMCAHRAECFSWSKVLSRKYLMDWKAAAGTALASLLGGFVCIGYDITTEKRAKPIPGKTVITILEPHISSNMSVSARNMSFASSRDLGSNLSPIQRTGTTGTTGTSEHRFLPPAVEAQESQKRRAGSRPPGLEGFGIRDESSQSSNAWGTKTVPSPATAQSQGSSNPSPHYISSPTDVDGAKRAEEILPTSPASLVPISPSGPGGPSTPTIFEEGDPHERSSSRKKRSSQPLLPSVSEDEVQE